MGCQKFGIRRHCRKGVRRRMPPILLGWLSVMLVATSSCQARSSRTAAPSSSSSSGALGPFSPQTIRNWVQARCGFGKSGVWVYKGSLYDPLDGRKIANVEGLEVVRCLAEYDGSKSKNDHVQSQQRYVERCGDLKASKMLLKQPIDYASTVLSRKLFCYTDPSPGQREQSLLQSIRIRPNAPLRKIPMNQAVAVYDAAVTVAGRNDGRELIVHTEAPNGKCLWATASEMSSFSVTSDTRDAQTLDFTVHTRRRSSDVPDLDKMASTDSSGMTVSPKRSQLVQLGGSSKASEQGRFGVRETYSYSMETLYPEEAKTPLQRLLGALQRSPAPKRAPAAKVRYTRYGEGPPWYGPGKFCTLELQGHRVESVLEAPLVLSEFIAQRLPDFWNVHGPILDNGAPQAVADFRQRPSVDWRTKGANAAIGVAGPITQLTNRIRKKGSKVFERLRAASSLSAEGLSTL